MDFQSLDEFYEQARPCIESFNDYVLRHILYDHAKPDHLCFKCDYRHRFDKICELFESGGRLWRYDATISGRTIAYVRLAKPFETVLGPVEYLELQDQKLDGSQHAGFGHIEIYPVGQGYEDLVKQLESTEKAVESGHTHHPTHDFEISPGFLLRCTREPLVEKIKRELSEIRA